MEKPEGKLPTIKQQLAQSKVPPGSALEKLIRENQDFGMLHPDEVGDEGDLPLWLRVYWQKNHPDEQRSTTNPSASYPDVLYDMYAWMLAHPDLKPDRPAPPARAKKSPAAVSRSGKRVAKRAAKHPAKRTARRTAKRTQKRGGR